MSQIERRSLILFFILFAGLIGAIGQSNPKREFRAAWIATVENIDWPSKPGLSAKEQKEEFVSLLDHLKSAGLNAVIVQIRPATDAFYPSPFEPWSPYLTGRMDVAPQPYYDPLSFMIKAAHDRSMEFHAWLNPYRALNHNDLSVLSANHPLRQNPQWFVQYGSKYYFDPGIPASKWHILKVIDNLLDRYDFDALHFDDYFYPYKISGEEFPDARTFARHSRGFTDIEDWRRDNVSQLIQEIHDLIQHKKPAVQLGISPFSVWRNIDRDPERGSPTQAGQTCYDDLYADILLWLENGWIDYIAPQLYFPLGFDLIDPQIMMSWWAERSNGSKVYIGKGLYRVGSNNRKGWDDPEQLPNQIKLSRDLNGVDGSIFFSAKWFGKNPLSVIDRITTTLYRSPALLPEKKSMDQDSPEAPFITKVKRRKKFNRVTWTPGGKASDSYYYIVYRFNGGQAGNLEQSAAIRFISPFGTKTMQFTDRKKTKGRAYTYVVTAVNRNHTESQASNRVTIKSR